MALSPFPRPQDQDTILSKDGWPIEDRTDASHNKLPLPVIQEAARLLTLQGVQFASRTVDLGRPVGRLSCVSTTPADLPRIRFAVRANRPHPSRFILLGEELPPETSKVTLILKRASEKEAYILIASWFGEQAQPEPWDRRATPEAKAFWRKHALVWGSHDADPDTLTPIPPPSFL